MFLLRALLALLFACLLVAAPLRAQTPEGALAGAVEKFLADSFAETDAGIALVVSAAAPHGVAVLEALADRRMLASPLAKAVFYKDGAGNSFNLLTGAPAPLPDDATTVRLNNRLRGVVQAALGTMTLAAADPLQRLRAAEAAFKARDATALPALEARLVVETDPRVKKALAIARAAVLLGDTNGPQAARVAAVGVIVEAGDAEGLALLRQMQSGSSGALRTVVDQAIAAIERRQQVREAAQTVWFGISLGSVLLLAAIGLAITFGVMGVINMAHGEMVMIGAYVTFVVQEVCRTRAPGLLDWSLPLAVPLAFLITGLIGVAIERGVIRFLYGRPLETLLATFGVSLVIQQAVRSAFGPTNREVSAPSYMSGAFDLFGLQITYGRLWIVVFTFAVFLLLLLALRHTPLGLQMRAVTQNRRMAASMGIRTRFVDAMTFGLGSGIAGIAGVALSQIDNVSPNLGQNYIIDSFMVVVFGGVGNLWGTLISAMALGVANKLLEPFAGAVLGKILILVLLILFIQKRPRGLFALKGRAVES